MTEGEVAVNGGPGSEADGVPTQQTDISPARLYDLTDDRPRLTADDLITDRALDKNDPDRLRHLPIARELAELAVKVETPANIALFGPWGSGKSSVLASVSRILQATPPHTKTVRYDAWKYGGSSLQRNFIFNAAAELGLPDDSRHRDYYRGLYEKSRTVDIRFADLLKSGWASIAKFVGLAVGLLVLLWVLAAAIALATGHKDILGQLTFQIVLTLPWAVLVPLGAATVQSMLQGARVDFEQTAPSSDEQFSRTFRKLISEAVPHGRFGGKRGRLVFLIDELDRCSPSDVAATLAALKTFLDEKDCVFIVAIDREALERALRELPQAAPVDEDNPYYSSASSFIDKVFQQQVSLPPVRSGRLTRLAGELVQGRGGVWGDLVGGQNASRSLELVLYALIPSHVRSPRRVKILLNNFATAARIAEARGIDWLGRAAELAKLVALRTEFPVFANDLFDEPRLPSLLLHAGPTTTLSPRSRALVARYAAAEPQPLPPPEPRTATAAQATPQAPRPTEPPPVALDPPIAKVDKASADVLARIQNQQLGRYLQRTARIKDPGRDLLYVESAGALADIHDSALGQLIEDYGPDAPEVVVKEMASQQPGDRLKALLLLIDMADRDVGLERSNCVQALLGITDQLGDDIGAQADRVAESVSSYLLDQQLPEQSLPSALRLACRASRAGRALERLIIDDTRLLSNRSSLTEVAALIGMLDRGSADLVKETLVEEATATPDFATEVLPHMGPGPASAFITAIRKPVQTALATVESSGGAAKANEYLDAFWVAIGAVKGVNAGLLADFGWILLTATSATAYNSIRSHLDYLTALDDPRKTRHALMAITKAPEVDWPVWTEMITDRPVRDLEDEFVVGAVKSVFTRTTWNDPSASAASAAATSRIAAASKTTDAPKLAGDLTAALQPLLGARSWWLNPAERQIQAALHKSVASLKSSESLVQVSDDLAASQLVRALPPTAPVTAETYPGLSEMGALLEFGGRLDLVRRIQESVTQPQPPSPTGVPPLPSTSIEPLGTIMRLIAAGDGGLAAEDWGIATSDVCRVAKSGTADGDHIAAVWLTLKPASTEVEQLAEAWVGRSLAPLRQALKSWASGTDQNHRTRLAVELVKSSFAPEGWISVVAEVGVDEEAVIVGVQSELTRAKQFERRQRIVDHLLELHPTTRSSQRQAAECALALLDSGKKNDFELASRLGPAIGDGHRLAGQLSAAFNNLTTNQGWTIPEANRRSLESAGLKIYRRRSLRDRILRRPEDKTTGAGDSSVQPEADTDDAAH